MGHTDKWEPSPGNPVGGQRKAQEAFADWEAHLQSIGYLPDECFPFDESRWGNGREFPSDGYLTNQVDYGSSEGIYLDITLEYQQNGEQKWERFATGKTLGETGEDLDRMNLIASAVTKAFHADGVHARYAVVGGNSAPEGGIFYLNSEERRIVADSLARQRESPAAGDPDAPLTDRLLNRILGIAAGQEDTPARGVVFSRVQLQADTGEEADFYISGIPRSCDDLEDDPEFIDFTEFLSTGDAITIDATITIYAEGGGVPRDAGQEDIDRINKAAAELDPDCDPANRLRLVSGRKVQLRL
jgi:hypothetical protein